MDVKIKEEVREMKEFGVQKAEIPYENNEGVFYGANLFNFYNYSQPFMGVHGYPAFYYCPMSAFVPVNQGYS